MVEKYPSYGAWTVPPVFGVASNGLNIFDWLASKSKLKQVNNSTSTTAVPTTSVKSAVEDNNEEAPFDFYPKVHSVDGDVMQFWQSSREAHMDTSDSYEDNTDENSVIDHEKSKDDMDLAESTLQVRYKNLFHLPFLFLNIAISAFLNFWMKIESYKEMEELFMLTMM